ncbi:hypothetical protein [Microbacterium sp. P01]|uniref:hypothetical protein n=1 Tax=unclassified Microbacterium TaxID=2609290 RepID=UPI003670F82E
MSTKRLWVIAGAAAVLFAVVVALAMVFVPRSSEVPAAPSPTASSTGATAPTPSPSTTPTETASSASPPPQAITATCENTATPDFLALMAGNGWISAETQDAQSGARPFDRFPNGSPERTIICRWGADPGAPTDNVIDLAWSPIDSENAAAAIQSLVDSGYLRTDEAIGVRLSAPQGDDVYLFTGNDVRWAPAGVDVGYITAPPGFS